MRTRGFAPLLLRCVACLLVLPAAIHAPPLMASRVKPVNLEEMTASAKTIVSGECVSVEIVRDPELGLDVASITLRVDRTVKGRADEIVTVRMIVGAGAPERGSGVAGMPRFEPGERVILFLYGESASGLTSPVGLGQGKFTVHRDKQGREVALNGFPNRLLFQRLSADALTRLGERPMQWKDREGLPPSTLLEMVESLVP